MRAAMNTAEVGDDVFHEDPTINRLEERVASLLGKEAALFVPSGSMSNQICVKVHTQPGDELLCDVDCHIYNYEAGGPAALSGVTCRTLDGDYGILDVSQLSDKIRAGNDHLVRTRLVCLENTHNRGGGRELGRRRGEGPGRPGHQEGQRQQTGGPQDALQRGDLRYVRVLPPQLPRSGDMATPWVYERGTGRSYQRVPPRPFAVAVGVERGSVDPCSASLPLRGCFARGGRWGSARAEPGPGPPCVGQPRR